jgi:two-component system response regulator RegX3
MANGFNTVLLVENDVNAAMPLIMGLQDEGFRPLHARDSRQGLDYARSARPDLVLLDAMRPRMEGFRVCRRLREESVVPIIMLDDHDHEADRIKGLELGADDYLVRPVSLRELAARVRAQLRRRELDRRHTSPPDDTLTVQDVVLDCATQQVWRAGQLIEMPQREFDVLRVLMEHAGQAVSRQQITDEVWGEDWVGYERTLNVHVYRLRQKLENEPAAPRYIETVRSYGYRFVVGARQRMGNGTN